MGEDTIMVGIIVMDTIIIGVDASIMGTIIIRGIVIMAASDIEQESEIMGTTPAEANTTATEAEAIIENTRKKIALLGLDPYLGA